MTQLSTTPTARTYYSWLAPCFVLFLLVSNHTSLLAQKTWVGGTSTNWATSGNWSPAAVPTASDDVVIPATTNKPTILSGTSAVAKSVTVQTGAELSINQGASLSINGASSQGILNEGTLTNSGNLIIGATSSVGDYGIWNKATFGNAGEITIDRSGSIGIYNETGTFTNAAKITIGATALAGNYGIWNRANFTNNTGGHITIDRTSFAGINNPEGSTFINNAKVTLGAIATIGGNAIINRATFTNNTCSAVLRILSNSVIFNRGSMTNSGSIIENASGTSSITSNAGSIQNLNGGTFTVGSGNAPVTSALLLPALGVLWTGCTSTDWLTATNWATGSIPQPNELAVIIPSANQPILSASQAANIQSVTVETGASLTLNTTSTLNINGSSQQGILNKGTISNAGAIAIGATATTGLCGILNVATFNNTTGGTISIDNSTFAGLKHESGTFTNTALITIGANASVGNNGLYNQATFNNNTGGEIGIDRSGSYGIYNDTGTFTNAAKITIGAIASVGDYGIENAAIFNNMSGEITIDRSSYGIYNDTGTFTNAAKITIGAIAFFGGYGIENAASFNNMGGEITIDRSTSYGIYNDRGTFTNTAKITIGAIAFRGSVGIYNQATFNNNTGGEIGINRSWSQGLYNFAGTFTNVAKITIGAIALVGNYGIHNGATFNNNIGGDISIDNTEETGLFNSFNFTNEGKITMGAIASVGVNGLQNSGTFYNVGEIRIDRSGSIGIINDTGTGSFTNGFKITMGANASIGGIGIDNRDGATFLNEVWGDIRIDRTTGTGLSNQFGTFINIAKITIGAIASVGENGIYNASNFLNISVGDINIDRATENGIWNPSGVFDNYAKITIGALANAGGYGLHVGNFGNNEAEFNNGFGGEILIDNTSTGIRNSIACTFTNAANITIGATALAGFYGILNYGAFYNNTCSAVIRIVSNSQIFNYNYFTNSGSIIENASGNSSISDNTGGIIQNLNGGTFSVGSGNVPVATPGALWIGCTSTDWATPSNWITGSLPLATEDVIIPKATNQPIITTAVTVHSVTVEPLATLTLSSPGSLSIGLPAMVHDGALVYEGTLTLGELNP